MKEKNKLVVFQDKKIRRDWHNNEWYFSIIDIIEILTDSENPRKYWSVLKTRLKQEGNELATNCSQLKLVSSDDKMRLTDVANTKQIFRLIQSVPSKKAEPLKQWLAQVGYERIEEIENPELGQDRIKEYYELKGYPKEWIDKRLRGIAARQELTDEWKNRDIQSEKEFAILTNEISKATFGMTIKEYKNHKKLPEKSKANLRDHMNDLELIFTMLGEKTTTEITKERNSQGFDECKDSAKEGGEAANDARKSVERRLGKSTISKENYLPEQEKRKMLTKMNEINLIGIVKAIVKEATKLKNKHIDINNTPVNYACIFSKSKEEYEELLNVTRKIGKIIKETPTGFLFQIKPIDTISGQLKLLKIRIYDLTRPERGDADFTISEFEKFEKKYLPKKGFKLMKKENFYMIELIDSEFDVRAYFSNPPLNQQLNIS